VQQRGPVSVGRAADRQIGVVRQHRPQLVDPPVHDGIDGELEDRIGIAGDRRPRRESMVPGNDRLRLLFR
jgi:hypothetical protein